MNLFNIYALHLYVLQIVQKFQNVFLMILHVQSVLISKLSLRHILVENCIKGTDSLQMCGV